jgi:flagellar hook-length control protein FliK
VPQVASEVTTYSFKPTLPNPARAAPSSDHANGSQFESLIDDGTQAPAAQPPQSPPAPADQTASAAQQDSAPPPAKAEDAKAAQPSGNAKAASATDAANAGNAAGTVTTGIDCKALSDGKVKADAKICEQTKVGDDSKAAGEGKPTDGSAPATLAADPATGAIQTITPAAVVTPTTPSAISQAASATVPQAAPAAVQAAIVAADAPKAKSDNLAARQADAGTPADDLSSSVKTASTPQGDGKPAPAIGEADKQAATHPHDDVPLNTHHAAAETPPPIATDAQATAPKTTGDIAQQVALTTPSQDVAPVPANPAAPAPPAAQAAVPLAGVAIEIAGQAMAGKNRFEIRLDPPELGRIEVRLDVDRDGQVTTRLIADRSDTLDLLRRDASGLERALQDAGLKTADNSLQFSLRDQTMGREQSNTPTPGAAQIIVHDDALPVNDATQRNYSRLAGLRGGIDIRV